ncbi:SIR2 family protein, partial [Enterovibrio baiacu]|uniref:SIR2 family protein n=1 Tax=Enterovibrio baiacu TaxID=2491023 RepID=UPI003D0B681D
MRFIEDGPPIPDELLLARDQGRVVFFCGAGVSRAKAGFDDFFGLASTVTTKLGVQQSSRATKLIEAAKTIDIEGVVSADRIFGELEREFFTHDIYEAVAGALTPESDVDLSAHQTMLKLATTDGVVRIVTTNFDRLFDLCDAKLKTFVPPKLPQLSCPSEFDGVIYLHGKVNENATGAEGNGFVLSSSEFGEAYLANGWATSFVKNILEKYVVVFVGYSADDPPIQYLLEALNKSSNVLNDIYAFQIGNQSEANSKWVHKGVKAIPFNEFDSLWETLESWSERAIDPVLWYKKIMEMSKGGPESLKPFERGQVAHIVSTLEGMKEFKNADIPPSAAWLNVFDPDLRYKRPQRSVQILAESEEFIDPFDLYSIDSDPIPQRVDPDNFYAERSIPNDVWNAFSYNKRDFEQLKESYSESFWGDGIYSPQYSTMPPRLNLLAGWFSEMVDQKEAIWWAVDKPNLHPWVKVYLRSQISFRRNDIDVDVYSAWLYIL